MSKESKQVFVYPEQRKLRFPMNKENLQHFGGNPDPEPQPDPEPNPGGNPQPQPNPEPSNAQVLTLEAVQSFFASDEAAKKWLQSEKDSYFTNGLNTFKEKTMPKLIEKEIEKRYPPETPEQKQIREMREEMDRLQQERSREAMKNRALSYATQKKLPISITGEDGSVTSIVDLLIGENEEQTLANVALYETIFQTALQSSVEERFKDNGRDVHHSGGQPPTVDDLEKQYNEALKAGNTTLAIALKNKIFAERNKKG